MKRSTVMLLVCLVFFNVISVSYSYQNQDSINVVIDPVSDQTILPGYAQLGSNYQVSNYEPPIAIPAVGHRTPIRAFQPSMGYSGPISKIRPAACPPTVACGPKPEPPCILPKRMPRQWEFSAQVFWPRLSGTLRWPALVNGLPATEMDMTDDLGLPKHPVIGDYSAYYQLNWNWSIFYAIMPIHLSGDTIARRSLNFGVWNIGQGSPVRTKWDFLYQRVGLMYNAINTCNATLSIYTGWLYNDQKITGCSDICGGIQMPVSRTRNMLISGLELKKCIRTLCNGGTLSCDTKAGIGYLDNTLVLDIQPAMRFSVPLNCGRWGFIRGGYRLLNFYENRTDLKMDVSMEGGFAEAGLIF
jgi:hypothetical protein